jgi:peptide/nickel transport system permease protein
MSGCAGVPSMRARFGGRGQSVLVVAALGIVALAVLFAVAGALIAPFDPNVQHLRVGVTGPNARFLLGTDDLGRDIWSRVIVGARTALVGPLIITGGAFVLGNLLGILAGYVGGWVDAVIMRWVDLMWALPGILIAIVIVGVLGGGYLLAVALLVVVTTPNDARIVRGSALEQRGLVYVQAARTIGFGPGRIMLRHVWPNVLPVAVPNAFLNFAFSIVNLTALSFLGLGVSPQTPDWGRMLSDGRSLLFDNPLAAIAPATMIVLTAASVNLLGDVLFERLSRRGIVH